MDQQRIIRLNKISAVITAIGFVITALVLATIITITINRTEELRSNTLFEFNIEHNIEDTKYQKTTMNMSAHMAIATKQDKWVQRFSLALKKFNASNMKLKKNLHKYPKIYREYTKFNQEVTNHYQYLLTLLKSQQWVKAASLLNSPHYKKIHDQYQIQVKRIDQRKELHLAMLHLIGIILRYDEILTMSARLAASTGESKWISIYKQHEPLLDQAIKSAITHAPSKQASGFSEATDQANSKLLKIENQAFALIKAGKSKEAQTLLYSHKYIEQKKIYSQGMNQLYYSLKLRSTNLIKEKIHTDRKILTTSIALFIILSILWISIFIFLRKNRVALYKNNEKLKHLNDELDDRVNKKTMDLQSTNKELKDEMSQRKKVESEKMSLQKQLMQSQKLESLGKLAGGIAHDFNNLLGGILGNAELLELDLKKSNIKNPRVSTIVNASIQGSKLVQQMLDFAKISKHEIKTTDLNKVITDTKNLLEHSFGSDIVVTTVLEKKLPNIMGDSSQLHQVIMNLCINASDAMPSGGEVIISTSLFLPNRSFQTLHPNLTAEQYVELNITDEGSGISKETIEKIYDPFFSTKSEAKNSGLGLSVVYGIIESHEGEIAVNSKKGQTTFTIYLPITQSTDEEEESDAQTEPRSLFSKYTDANILVVDDEHTMRQLATDILQNIGLNNLHIATSGKQAINICKQKNIELAILDIVMPEMGGLEAAKEIQKNSPKTALLFISGYVENKNMGKIKQLPLTDFIPKPYLSEQFISKVASLLHERDML